MKSRTKSTKANLTIQAKKSRKRSQDQQHDKSNKHLIRRDENETRRNLLNTLHILENRLKLKPNQKLNSSNMNKLSRGVYKIVNQYVPKIQGKNGQVKKNKNHNSHHLNNQILHVSSIAHLPIKDSQNRIKQYNSINYSRDEDTKQTNNNNSINNNINNSSNVHNNSNHINEIQMYKHRSNSTLQEYFKDKFGSPAKDEQSIQKKLRVLKALKKTQTLMSKNGISNRTQFHNSVINSACEINDKNIVIQKIRRKCQK